MISGGPLQLRVLQGSVEIDCGPGGVCAGNKALAEPAVQQMGVAHPEAEEKIKLFLFHLFFSPLV